MTTATSPRKLPFLMLLLAAAPLLTAGSPRAYAPELTTTVARLQSDVQAKGLTFTVGLNPAMQYDLKQLCGTRLELRPADYQAHAEGGYLNFEQPEAEGSVAYPQAYLGWFSSVKDQGQCGSCWDFSTIATLEAAALKKHGAPQGKVNADGSITTSGDITILSEQQVLSCNPFGFSCDGGYFAFDMLMPKNAGQFFWQAERRPLRGPRDPSSADGRRRRRRRAIRSREARCNARSSARRKRRCRWRRCHRCDWRGAPAPPSAPAARRREPAS